MMSDKAFNLLFEPLFVPTINDRFALRPVPEGAGRPIARKRRFRHKTFLLISFNVFPFLFCALPLPCPCRTLRLALCLALFLWGLIFIEITDSYDGNACLVICLNHCRVFEAFPKSLDPPFVAVQSARHIALRDSDLPPLKIDCAFLVADAARLPGRLCYEPSKGHCFRIVTEIGMPQKRAMKVNETAHPCAARTRRR